MKSIICILLILLSSTCVYAEDIKEVIAVGPSWDRFTNRDGTGLYHEILHAVFGLYGIPVRRIYVPSERAYDLVRSGRADMMTCHDEATSPLQLAHHPMFAGRYYVFFNKERIGEWKGVESLRDKVIVWRLGYYAENNFPVPVQFREVKTGSAALGMVLLGRADFYVDDMAFIETSMKENKIPYDRNAFDMRMAGYRNYYPVLLRSERGDAIRELYDQGIEMLARSGRLQDIFAKWGFPFPPYRFAEEGK